MGTDSHVEERQPDGDIYITVEPGTIQSVEEAKAYLDTHYPELSKVAQCESSWRPHAKNSKSSASGILMFLDSTAKWVHPQVFGTELHMDNKNDLATQIRMAIWLYEKYELSQWQYPCGTLMEGV